MNTNTNTNTNTNIAHHHRPNFSLKLSSYKVTLALFGLLFLGVVMPAKALEFNEGANPGNTVFTVGEYSSVTLGNATGNEFYTLFINGHHQVGGRQVIPGLTYYSARRAGAIPARISGTPTVLRESTIKYSAAFFDDDDKIHAVEFQFLLVVVAPIPTFPEGSNPGDTKFTVGDVSSITLGSASRNPDYVLSINGANAVGGGELVPGLTYHSQSGATPATISGTPTAVGEHVITYTASIHYDSDNINAIEFEFTLSIVPAVPEFYEGANPGNTEFFVGRYSSVTLGNATRNPFYSLQINGYREVGAAK